MFSFNKLIYNFFHYKNVKVFKKQFLCIGTFVRNENLIDYEKTLNNLKQIDFTINRPNFQGDSFSNLIDMKLSQRDWQEICNKAGSKMDIKKLPNVILSAFVRNEKMNLMDSFLNFMLKFEKYHNPYVILSTIQFLANNAIDNYLEEFVDIYKDVVKEKEYEVLFYMYIEALLNTKMRNEAINLLQNRPKGNTILRLIILTSPANESWDILKNYFELFLSTQMAYLTPEITEKVLTKIENGKSLKEFLDLLYVHKIHIWTSNMVFLNTLVKNLGLKLKLNSIDELSCNTCGSSIPKALLDDKTCQEIAEIIMIDVMRIQCKEELYQNSSPEEILRFKAFIKTCHFPFNCVIDFPNLINMNKKGYKEKSYSNDINFIVKSLILLNEKNPTIRNICLVGKRSSYQNVRLEKFIYDVKQELQKYQYDKRVKLNVSYYFSHKLTKDDVLALYVALKSGPNCYIVSNDEYRDHRAKIKEKRLQIFMKDWQNCRQILIPCSSMNKMPTRVYEMFQMPYEYVKGVSFDKDREIYHIPYANDKDDASKKTSFSTNVRWACLQF